GDLKVPPEAGHHAHESPLVMTVPLMILSVGAVAAGAVVEPFTHWLSHLLEGHWLVDTGLPVHKGHGMNLVMTVGSSLFELAGVGLAWWFYSLDPRRELVNKLVEDIQGVYQLSLNKFHVDELYEALIVKPLVGFAEFCRIFDLYV